MAGLPSRPNAQQPPGADGKTALPTGASAWLPIVIHASPCRVPYQQPGRAVKDPALSWDAVGSLSELLEQRRGGTPGGVIARVMQRILAPTAAIWHNDHTGQHVLRSLTAYDH